MEEYGIPATRRVEPDLISLTASSAESQTFDLLGTGISAGVLYSRAFTGMAIVTRNDLDTVWVTLNMAGLRYGTDFVPRYFHVF